MRGQGKEGLREGERADRREGRLEVHVKEGRRG